MTRFNPFLLIHKGLRGMLFDTALAIQTTDFSNDAVALHSLEKLSDVLQMFDGHAAYEDKYIFCLLKNTSPLLWEKMELEHIEDVRLSHELRSLISQYRFIQSAAEKRSLGYHVEARFSAFVAFNLTHFNKEETEVNETLWEHYSDEQIMQANYDLVNGLSQDETRKSAVWMFRGCNDTELKDWLSAVKAWSSTQTLELLLNIAEKEIPADRFKTLCSGIL